MFSTLYQNICETLSAHKSEENLRLLKEHFKRDIESNRLNDKIDSIRLLIKVLQRRDVVNEGNVEPLRYISNVFNNREAHALLEEYDRLFMRRSTCPNRLDLDRSIELEQGDFIRPVLPNVSQDPVKRIEDMIADEIGDNWKRLARHLEIPEGHIDQLEICYRRISDRVYEILRYQRERDDQRLWKVNLCFALERARRKDLSDKVQMMCARHGLV